MAHFDLALRLPAPRLGERNPGGRAGELDIPKVARPDAFRAILCLGKTTGITDLLTKSG